MSSVYFGNAQKQTWIKAPQTGMNAPSLGWSNQGVLLSGKAFVKRSTASHRRFEMSWLGSRNDPNQELSLQTIKDFADGIHGPGPYFWLDPYAIDQNLFSPAWASSFLSVDSDWETICPDGSPIAKSVVSTQSISALVGSNTQGYPSSAAKFVAPGSPNAESNKFTFYIPDGYTLWLGAHGHHGETGAALAKPYSSAGVAGTPVSLTMLGVNTATRFNVSFASTAAKKVEFYLAKVASSPCTFHLVGLMAQILPTGVAPSSGAFISGRGVTGLEFSTMPTMEYYSAKINNGQIGMSTTFVEV